MSRQFICTRVEFNCEVCGVHVSKWWHPRYYGKPRFCSRACKNDFQRRAKPVTRKWLEQKYVTEGLDCTQIGKLVSRDSKSVWNWLKDFGIPTRPRGGNHPTRFQPGDKCSEGTVRKKSTGIRTRTQTTYKPGGRQRGYRHSEATKKKLSDIAKAQGRVPYDPAVGSYMKGRKGADHPCWKGGITPERQVFNATPEWKHAVYAVKKRDKHTCQRCGRVKIAGDGAAFDIHHIVSFECVELRAVASNLVYLCEPCHYWVHGKGNTNKDFIREE